MAIACTRHEYTDGYQDAPRTCDELDGVSVVHGWFLYSDAGTPLVIFVNGLKEVNRR